MTAFPLVHVDPVSFSSLFFLNLFPYFIFGCAGSLLLHSLSPVAASWGLLLSLLHGLLTAVASLVADHRL